MLLWLGLSLCYVVFLVLEYKNDLQINPPREALLVIESATDIERLRRTAKMHINFLYGVHDAALFLWKINLAFGIANIGFMSYCLVVYSSSKKANLLDGN